jgi:hypothetical protein
MVAVILQLVFMTLISLYSVKWARGEASKRDLKGNERQHFVRRYVGVRILALVAGFVVYQSVDYFASDTAMLYFGLVLLLTLAAWMTVHFIRFKPKRNEEPFTQRLFWEEPTRKTKYHDYRICIYTGGWRKPEGHILPTPFLKESESQGKITGGRYYTRNASVDDIEADLKHKINQHLGLEQ